MKKLTFLLTTIIAVILFSLTLRGNLGIPSSKNIESQLHSSGQAFETSQERARYAMILSLYYDKSVTIDNYASMATPDLGKLNGHYYSLFPPTVSVMAIPLYALGLIVGATQMMVFGLSTLFTILTMLLIVKFCQKLNIHWSISMLSAITYAFATNAWGYSVTLYAHTISAFFILAGLYLVSFGFKNYIIFRNALVWFIYGLAVYIDYPNIFIYFPIVVLLTLQGFTVSKNLTTSKLSFDWRYFVTPFIFISMLGFYGLYNYTNFGSPTQFSNALPRVQDLKDADKATPERQKNNGQALKSRNMLEGIRVFTISHDRGVLVFSPIILFSILGIGFLKAKQKTIEVGLVGVPLACFLLYIMFGDPYGGWAFGSRYLLAIFPPLCILAGIGLQKYSRSILLRISFFVLFSYSAGVSLLAPLTTNVIPPEIEATGLGLRSDYSIAWDMLKNNSLNSFVYNNYLSTVISGQTYYWIILCIVLMVGVSLLYLSRRSSKEL